MRAEDLRTVELGIAYIDGDDESGPRERRALNHIESHRTAADDDDTGAWRDRRLACGSTHSGHDAATDQAGTIERNLFWHSNGAGLGHDAVLRVRGHDGEVMHLAAVAREPRATIEQQSLGLIAREGFAQDGQILLAVEALPAMRIPRAHDVVAGFHESHVRADRLHHSGALVAQHDRKWIGERSFYHFQIGVAQAARANAYQHIGRLQLADLDGFDSQRTADFVQQSCAKFHATDPSDSLSSEACRSDSAIRSAARGSA